MLRTFGPNAGSMLLTASIAASLGDMLFDLYISWSLAANLGSVMAAAAVLGSSAAFQAVVALVVGSLVDRFRPRTAMLGGLLGSLVVLAAFAMLASAAVRSIPVAVTLVLINDFFQDVFGRACVLAASRSLTGEGFVKFQARNGIAGRVVGTVGLLGSGVLVAFGHPAVIAATVSAFYACAALAVIPVRLSVAGKPAQKRSALRAAADDLRLVGRTLFLDPFLRSFTLILLIANLAYGFVPRMLPLAMSLHRSVNDLTAMRVAIAIGELIGLVVVDRLARKIGPLFRVSMVGAGLAVVVATLGLPQWVVLVAFGLYGLFDSLSQPLFSYAITRIDPESRGRVLGGIDAIVLLSPSIGLFIGSFLAERSLVLSGIYVTVIFAICLMIALVNPELAHPEFADEETA